MAMAAPLPLISLLFIILATAATTATAATAATAATTTFPQEALPTKSGYLPIPVPNASLYYTFYEATHPLTPAASTPLLVWLEGGPGLSSFVGNFFLIGPYVFSSSSGSTTTSSNTSTFSLSPNPYAWNRRFGLLFIDSPLGTGFSTAPSRSAIPTTQPVVAEHVLAALQSFLSTTGFHSRPVFLTGENNSGKTIPALGALILATNPTLPVHNRINLRGVAIGDGVVHPAAQVTTPAATLYFMGLINARQRREAAAMQDDVAALAVARRWREAADARGRVTAWLQNATGLSTLFDVAAASESQLDALAVAVDEFMDDAGVRAALGVRADADAPPFVLDSADVEAAFHDDTMKSVKPEVEALLVAASVRVLLYEGTRDAKDGVPAAEAWIRELEWDGLAAFQRAPRAVWRRGSGAGGEGQKLAGYVQKHGELVHVAVHEAGHLVPGSQPQAAQEMIENWVFDKGLFSSGGAAA